MRTPRMPCFCKVGRRISLLCGALVVLVFASSTTGPTLWSPLLFAPRGVVLPTEQGRKPLRFGSCFGCACRACCGRTGGCGVAVRLGCVPPMSARGGCSEGSNLFPSPGRHLSCNVVTGPQSADFLGILCEQEGVPRCPVSGGRALPACRASVMVRSGNPMAVWVVSRCCLLWRCHRRPGLCCYLVMLGERVLGVVLEGGELGGLLVAGEAAVLSKVAALGVVWGGGVPKALPHLLSFLLLSGLVVRCICRTGVCV